MFDTIAAPKLLPYAPCRPCPACGANTKLHHRLTLRVLGGSDRHMRWAFCEGGKEPTGEGHVATLAGMVRVEHRHACAGIGEPHLHGTCCNCGHTIITRTSQRLGE